MCFVWLIGGAVIGFAVGYAKAMHRAGKKISPETGVARVPNPEQTEERRKRLGQIEEYLKTHEQITNDEVVKLLSVDDSTAVRYCDELERQGKLAQIGKTGRSVTYKKT